MISDPIIFVLPFTSAEHKFGNVLATDLAQHLRIMGDQRRLATEGYEKTNETHHGLLLSLLMTCCDLGDQTKDWRESKKIAVSVITMLLYFPSNYNFVAETHLLGVFLSRGFGKGNGK